MSKPWGNIGAWAADSERAEAEEREAQAAAAVNEAQNFPSLKEAVNAKPKKKKSTTVTLSEFNRGSYASGENQGLTPDELLRLPTGPKDRSGEEMQFNRLGGGFSSYDRSGPRTRDRDGGNNDGSWGGGRRSYGGFDEERRGPVSRVSEFDQPSRADEVDNWASVKKPLPSFDSGRQNRYSGGGGGGSGGFGGASRADGVDNWAVGKKPLSVRSSTFGSGYRDSGVEHDRWTRGAPRDVEPDRWTRGAPREVERPRLVLDPPRGDGSVNEAPVKTNKPSPFGAARPREEVLAEKGLDWKKMDSEIEAKKTSQPTSAHSSRPSSAQSSRSEGPGLQGTDTVPKSKPKVNPFGDAKPREVLLGERGMDWRKIDLDLEHRGVDRPETMEEKLLKEEIDNLKKELEKESTINSNYESVDEAGGDQTIALALLAQKERELELLIHDLDDKVRFGQKAVERPGSSAGKATASSDRPPSRSSSFEDSRSVDFADRPQSRGTGDMWMRPSDDRRQFQGSRERGWFSGSRDLNRSRSRERW
ncbi:eukaryotic translation initiation factor 4B2-like [Abrus precatorius]|uniref:Eukaryotic translation initiation factor 4B2-like n=1 Tax=Abrus precatorius TaxID=3816 RepID=A0A8B8M9S7_ABRPR|nr:eukaryotic translation initiation factor 4B2-like [Abrus precatorius]